MIEVVTCKIRKIKQMCGNQFTSGSAIVLIVVQMKAEVENCREDESLLCDQWSNEVE
jgi:hypothetical protein